MATPTDSPRPDSPTATPPEIDAVLFDLDDTLSEYRRSSQAVLDIAFDRARVEPFFTAADWRDLLSGSRDNGAFGEDRDTEFVDACFAELALRRERDPDPARAVARTYRDERDHTDVRFRPGAEEALVQASERYAVGLVTNGDEGMQTPKLETLGLTEAFDVTVFSSESVPPKPDPTPFETALEGLGVAAERTIHIGNDYVADVGGALEVGIEPVWLKDADDGHHPNGNGAGSRAKVGSGNGTGAGNGNGTRMVDSLYTLSDFGEYHRLPWF